MVSKIIPWEILIFIHNCAIYNQLRNAQLLVHIISLLTEHHKQSNYHWKPGSKIIICENKKPIKAKKIKGRKIN